MHIQQSLLVLCVIAAARISLWAVSDKLMIENDVKHSAEVVIIGGGVIGLTIARALALRGARDICLIERSTLGHEASFAAAGMLAPQAEANSKDDFFTLACRSRDMYADLAASLREE